MKATTIHYFSPEDNTESTEKSAPKATSITGYVSASGKLVFPNKSVEQLPFNPDSTQFKIGAPEGKRKLKSLYLVPGNDEQGGSFEMTKGAKSYTIPLAVILQKGGVDYANAKYSFTIKPFEFDGGITAYELQFAKTATDDAGKPRGRKKKQAEETE